MSAVIHIGDCLEVLKTLEDESVQTCITSPPYWGLRDYGVDGQLGLEETPEAFIGNMVTVFREVRRVLRKDGTLWLNLGDSYNGRSISRTGKNGYNDGRSNRESRFSVGGVNGLKPKDLIGMPWRVAFALQDDGWWLRQDIIWYKSNPMPESVTDRCTKAHEYVFLLSRSGRYYYDIDSIREPLADKTFTTFGTVRKDLGNDGLGRVKSSNYSKSVPVRKPKIDADGNILGANKKSVWTIPTKPYPEAHFATYPTTLVEPCVLAGSKEGDTVLDPFNGAGTTGLVALAKNRNYIGIELNSEYAEMSMKRIQGDSPMFNKVQIAA